MASYTGQKNITPENIKPEFRGAICFQVRDYKGKYEIERLKAPCNHQPPSPDQEEQTYNVLITYHGVTEELEKGLKSRIGPFSARSPENIADLVLVPFTKDIHKTRIGKSLKKK